ncbi:MAG: glycosyltransferase [Rhodospirillaceae bacterium]
MKNILFAGLFAALLQALAWWAAYETVTPPDIPGKLDSLSFNVGTPRKSWFGPTATTDDVERALAAVATVADNIRTYSTAGIMAEVPKRARAHGVTVSLGVWLGADAKANRAEIENAIRLIGHNPNISAIFVGNETQLRKDVTFEDLIGYIREVRARTNVAVTTGETWDVWIANPTLADEVDFMSIHVLPYWEAVPSQEAVDYTFTRFKQVTDAFPGKPAIIAEFGWPSRGYNNRKSGPDPLDQAGIIRSFVTRAYHENIQYNLMEAFDQPWKTQEGSVGPYWGIFNKNYQPKFELIGVVTRSEMWHRAILALVFGAGMTVVGLLRRRPRLGHALAYAIVANALCAGVAVAVLYPFGNYLNFGSALAWAIGVFLMMPLTLVTMSKVSEVAEVTLGHRPTRLWRAGDHLPPADARWPKVSVHIPACRENPAMLAETLRSVARLDYPDFEVLLIVNNTPIEAMWRPVEALCRELGPRFKFINFPQIEGFKAGAMNAAMPQMAANAEIIALLDADYVVSANWLKDLVPAFADPHIALVQAPQDHRDSSRSTLARITNAEYMGFFDIGMVQRNEVDAIVAHGTMLLIRRSAFEAAGGWTTDTITEDTELGLRLYEAGYGAVYTRQRYGWGLLPGNYTAFKNQRHRWAYGAVQIIRKHWRFMLPSTPGLTREQKSHFITGWFHWLSDAVGALAAVINLAWVPFILFVGALVPPFPFTLPILVAFWVGLFHCVLLYATRVRADAKTICAAALAAASLQWTVARAVMDGIRYEQQPFLRTAKGAGRAVAGPAGQWRERLRQVSTETWIGIALIAGSVILFAANTTRIFEISMFATTLAIQSLPFLAVTLMNALERRDAAKSHQAETPAPPAQEQPIAAD